MVTLQTRSTLAVAYQPADEFPPLKCVHSHFCSFFFVFLFEIWPLVMFQHLSISRSPSSLPPAAQPASECIPIQIWLLNLSCRITLIVPTFYSPSPEAYRQNCSCRSCRFRIPTNPQATKHARFRLTKFAKAPKHRRGGKLNWNYIHMIAIALEKIGHSKENIAEGCPYRSTASSSRSHAVI